MQMENIQMTNHAWNIPTNSIGEKQLLDWTNETLNVTDERKTQGKSLHLIHCCYTFV